jgi:alpha-1,6-mannosyltransferase
MHRPHLLDTTLFFSPTSGGVRRYLLAKHAWLNLHGAVRHTLLVPGPRHAGQAGAIVEFGSPRIPFGAGYRFPVRWREYARTVGALAPDLIEAGDPYQVGWMAAAAARRLGVPSVAFCHSDLIGLVEHRAGRRTRSLTQAYLRALYARFDLVLAPSRVVVDRLQDAGIPSARVQPLGVDADAFRPERADPALRAQLGLAPDTRLLVFAGRLAPEKNLPELYEAVRRLGTPYHLLVIGGEERASPAPRVTLLPYEREPPKLAAWFACADAFVHAGRQETFGLVALEALACGLPVVAYAAGAIPEIVDDAVGVLAAPRGPAALAEAIEALFAREQAPLRQAARARVTGGYTWDRAFDQQMRLYASLLNRTTLLAHAPEFATA